MNQPVIETKDLKKRYYRHDALAGVDMRVETGTIYGLLGPNGAGKTTTIQILMNLVRPSSGSAEVLGRPVSRLGWRDFQKIGYVSENQRLPEEMCVKELLDYLKPYYPSWDDSLCQELVAQLELPAGRKLSQLSRGMKMKAALVASLAFRPELLVLDEPFSGLDPVVREDFTRGLLGTIADSNGSVFMSSQDVEEVERLCDWVGIMKAGKLVISEPLDQLLHRFRRIEITAPGVAALNTDWGDEVLTAAPLGDAVNLVHTCFRGEETLANLRARVPAITSVEDFPLSLREIYLALSRNLTL